MVSSCTSARCTKCGRKRKTAQDIVSMRDSYVMDFDLVEALWSPLESSRGWSSVQQAPSSLSSPSPPSKTIHIDVVTEVYDSDDAATSPNGRKRQKPDQQTGQKRSSRREDHLSMTRFMQNFARGMASAFGTHISVRPRKVGRKAYLNDLELGDRRAPRSLLHGVLPSAPRIRVFFLRMGGKPAPLSPEQHPLAPSRHENRPSPYYPVIPNSFMLRY
jgi:hypothetical protein